MEKDNKGETETFRNCPQIQRISYVGRYFIQCEYIDQQNIPYYQIWINSFKVSPSFTKENRNILFLEYFNKMLNTCHIICTHLAYFLYSARPDYMVSLEIRNVGFFIYIKPLMFNLIRYLNNIFT